MRNPGLLAPVMLVFGSTLFVSSLAGKTLDQTPASRPNEVPFDLRDGYLIVIKGNLGPFEKVSMIVDTGTSPTIISTEVATKLSLRGDTTPQLTPLGTISALSVLLPSIKIGQLRRESIRVMVQDLRSLQKSLGIPVAAIAGLDLLRTGNFTIDYQHKKILFGYTAACRNSVPLESTSPLIVRMKIAQQQVRLLVDSGTPTVLLYGDRMTVPMDYLRDEATIVTGVGTLHPRWFVATKLTLGGQQLGGHAVLIANSEQAPANDYDGLLGLAMTGFHTVSFDFENKLLWWD